MTDEETIASLRAELRAEQLQCLAIKRAFLLQQRELNVLQMAQVEAAMKEKGQEQ